MSHLEVIEPGPLALVQDSGRYGHLAVGVGRAGAADLAAYTLGNRLVGNRLVGNPVDRGEAGAASIEVTFGGLVVRAVGDLTVCLTGALAPADVDGSPAGHACSFRLCENEILRLGTPTAGLRTYLSVRGGIDVPATLGSRSTDTMSDLDPAPLRAGDLLPVGTEAGEWPSVDHAPVPPPLAGEVTLSVTPGARYDWFASPDELATTRWSTSERSDRRGVRLTGGSLIRAAAYTGVELPSEPMVRGAIQVPPNGEPVVLLNDAPVTGGYPVIGVVRSADIDRVAQLRPGQPVRFTWSADGGH